MLSFPIHELMDEQKCYDYLRQVLHPDGLKCPRGHPLPAGQQPHDRHRAPIMDYRCRACGAVFNLFTDTMWSGSRYTCVQIVLILRGIAQGVPTEHHYVAVFEWMSNAKRVTDDLLRPIMMPFTLKPT